MCARSWFRGSTLTLQVDARGEKYLVNLDSRSQVLDHFPALQVHRAEHRVQLVQLEGQDFLNTLRSKLSWGWTSGPRSRGLNQAEQGGLGKVELEATIDPTR